jgi:hypothetical protein
MRGMLARASRGSEMGVAEAKVVATMAMTVLVNFMMEIKEFFARKLLIGCK